MAAPAAGAVLPVIYVDALVAKVRDGSAVRNKAVNLAVGIDTDGAKHVLGIWVAAAEGAKAQSQALAQLRNRGLEEVLFCCCDGLNGLGEEITRTWPGTTVQTCVVHLVRRSLGYASYNDRKAMAAALKTVYTACDADAAYAALADFSGTPLGRIPGRGRGTGKGVGPVHPVPGIRARSPESPVYEECHRLVQPGGLFIHPITGMFSTVTLVTGLEKFYPHFHSPR